MKPEKSWHEQIPNIMNMLTMNTIFYEIYIISIAPYDVKGKSYRKGTQFQNAEYYDIYSLVV